MKNLILTSILVLISLISFSQIITITYDYSEAYSVNGKYDNFELILTNKPLFSVSDNKTKKIINLNIDTMFVYYDDNLINTFKINKKTLKDNVYCIMLDDINIFTGSHLDTYQIIDLNNNKSHIYWFYLETNESWLISENIIFMEKK